MSEDPRADQFIEEIRNALIQIWDPKGVAKKPDLHDEYDDYLELILDHFEEESACADRIADLLLAIEQEDFKQKRSDQAAKQAGHAIWQAFERFIA
ncbi:hypothetical protein A3K93_04860 [Acinetobacter sp. NCu2D-2]|uniref:hypothetical protein n=1 Tax=Acinetobacter sp. NCu2D-2 TaxID=1608473 RepID=UPI0007CDD578|nr:hypothetical protein [Acinetobacter sp. NCu2D-2]ANF81579.1 hypothetical protein A3K93_04860 [Acinetobacter sp. NCu2D-2]